MKKKKTDSADNSRLPEKTRGRKRDDGRTEAILKAAADLLLEVGFDRFRVQDVAARAVSGTGAIYRRWPTKESLIIDAIKIMPGPETPMTNDPIADLRTLVAPKCKSAEQKPDLLPGLVAAMRSDEGIEEVVKAGYTMENFREVLKRIVGEDYPHMQLLCEMTSALILLRSSFVPEEINAEEMTEEIVSFIVSLGKK